jgi:hypothetical protein
MSATADAWYVEPALGFEETCISRWASEKNAYAELCECTSYDGERDAAPLRTKGGSDADLPGALRDRQGHL